MVRLRFSAMIPSRHNRADFISESHLLSLSLAEARKIKRLINLRLWHLRTISKGLYPVRITVATTFLQESIINDFVLYSLLRKIWPVEIHGLVFRLLTWFSHLESCRTLCPVWLNHHRISTGSASAWDSICAVVQIFFFQSNFSSSVNRFFEVENFSFISKSSLNFKILRRNISLQLIKYVKRRWLTPPLKIWLRSMRCGLLA